MATATMNASILERYHEPLWGRMDRTLRNCFVVAGILGVALLIAIFVVPMPPPMPVTVDDVPDRIARLILEKPKPAPAIQAPEQVAQPKIETPPEMAKPKPPPRQRTSKPRVNPDRGTQGRQKAQQEVTQNLASVSGSLDKVLEDVSKALPATDAAEPEKKKRRRRGVSKGRSSDQLSSVSGVNDLSAPDVSGSAIETKSISIAAISDLTVQDGAGGAIPQSGSGGSGSARSGSSDLRSNESLLGVVRRYAPGIQFCYDNELKKSPGLRGKLVVSMRVLSNGQVADVMVVEDTLGSSGVRNCVLAQIKGWQFPAIPQGEVSFKTPFVFTPPE